jgi:Fe-S-cluster-containing dehydrogenase component/anaerobic selenocysteine-containing dehydrogenase
MTPQHPKLWQTLEELAGSAASGSSPHHHGPPIGLAKEPASGPQTDRRTLLQLVAASLALGGLTGCGEPAVAPLLSQPVGDWRKDADQPLTYATTLDHDGYGRGVLVKTQGGRPVKIEGNPRHPASLGATDVFAQADVLSLYDPDRSRSVIGEGGERSLSDARSVLGSLGDDLKEAGGEGLRLLTGPVSSPSFRRLIAAFLREFPGARWHQYTAVANDGTRAAASAAFGEPVEAVYDFAQADVVVSLGGDILGAGPGQVRYAHDFAERRRSGAAQGILPRLYVAEPTPSLTGTRADRRIPLHPADLERFARALGGQLGLLGAQGLEAHPAVAAIAADLRQAGARALVVAGPEQPWAVQALAHAANARLGAMGRTVRYIAPVTLDTGHMDSLASLAGDIEAGAVRCLIALDANPVYHAPGDMDFATLMRRVPVTIHAGFSRDETGVEARWHLPLLHPLESWGDARAFDGTASLRQPATVPLAPALEREQVLGSLAGMPLEARQVVREHWREASEGGDFDSAWHAALTAGVVSGTAAEDRPVRIRPGWADGWSPPRDSPMTVLFAPDPAVWDGSYANNAWLQELPRPLTKLTWDNAALIAPATADDLGLVSGDVVNISAPDGQGLSAPIWVLPGQAAHTITLPLGYGRRQAGGIGTGVGFNAGSLRRAVEPWLRPGVSVASAGRTHSLVSTAGHHRMEGRDLVRLVAPGEAVEDPRLAAPSLYPEWPYDSYAWGMAIDLDACIGCNACVIACQAENNVPVVGRDEVALGREMHWLRIDRYYSGILDEPETYFQPLLCMHCEQAPCEVVCPVNATVHSSEGLNEMVYSRCIGTRTCSNNCPYKVRRFNWYDYTGQEDAMPVENPDVYVRPRGVMEKCTYCVQRIRGARITAGMEDRQVADGEIVTACQQACPTRAIVFGDVNDPASAVSRRKGSPRNYALLGELNTRPRTTYLARIATAAPEADSE